MLSDCDSRMSRRSVGGWSGEHGDRVAAGVSAEQVDEVGVQRAVLEAAGGVGR